MSKNTNIKPSQKRKRMKRPARLQAAKQWIPSYTGKNIVKGYRRWFGVDLPCAIHELTILDIKLDEQYIKKAISDREKMIQARKKILIKKGYEQEEYGIDSDENFYYIVGYTSGGFPYGITREEARELENLSTNTH